MISIRSISKDKTMLPIGRIRMLKVSLRSKSLILTNSKNKSRSNNSTPSIKIIRKLQKKTKIGP